MKKILSVLIAVVSLAACGRPADKLSDSDIYFFFSNTCPHCHHALEYINKKYPALELAMVNVSNPGGYDLLAKAAKQFHLGDRVGTPLIVFGDKYLMGWSPQYEVLFDEYSETFRAKER